MLLTRYVSRLSVIHGLVMKPRSHLMVLAELIQNYLEVGEYTFDFVVVFLGVSHRQAMLIQTVPRGC